MEIKKLDFNDNKIVTKVLLETSSLKEIRILLKQGQIMKEHKTPFTIIVHILDDIITLDTDISHDLKAIKDSIVRLKLSKLDKESERVEKVLQIPN